MVPGAETMEAADGGSRSATLWVVTFADLLSLMLTFFVLLFAMSSVNQDAWRAVTDHLAERLEPGKARTQDRLAADRTAPQVLVARAIDLGYLRAILEERLAAEPRLAGTVIRHAGDRLVVTLPGGILFAPAGTALAPDAEGGLQALGQALTHVANRVQVQGHADPSPVPAGGAFASNWELSLARALAVADALRAAGYGFPIEALGRGDGRYYDLSADLPEAERRSLGRRVDLVIRQSAAWDDADG